MVRQGWHKRSIERIQTKCFITLSRPHLSGKCMADLDDGIEGIQGVICQIQWYAQRLERGCRLFPGDGVLIAFFVC